MRLDKFIGACTSYSRKDIKKLARDGAVKVNGETVKKTEIHIDENNDRVTLLGKALEYKKHIYLMMNKPPGYVSATEDKKLSTVTELLPEEYARFSPFPAGRLDIDTEGLLILTDDGDFAHRLTSPKKDVKKRYFARLDIPAEEKDIKAFAESMDLGDFVAKPALLEITEDPYEVYVTISEGKFHQVKRMCEKVGKNVVYLKRVSIGKLSLDESLEPGEVQELSEKERELIFERG